MQATKVICVHPAQGAYEEILPSHGCSISLATLTDTVFQSGVTYKRPAFCMAATQAGVAANMASYIKAQECRQYTKLYSKVLAA